MVPSSQATRGDRQPSFSQVDLEMTFSDQEVIMQLTEDLLRAVFSEASPAAACQPSCMVELQGGVKLVSYSTVQ